MKSAVFLFVTRPLIGPAYPSTRKIFLLLIYLFQDAFIQQIGVALAKSCNQNGKDDENELDPLKRQGKKFLKKIQKEISGFRKYYDMRLIMVCFCFFSDRVFQVRSEFP